jgi:prepilin-type N-terminal cleavage/methylation domain-containing protein
MNLQRDLLCMKTDSQRSLSNVAVERADSPESSGNMSTHEKPKHNIRAESGFTLLEVLVALTVFAVGAAITLSLISGSLGNIRKVQLRTRTIEQAESVMETALLEESIQQPTTFSGYFEDGMRWLVRVDVYELPEPQQQLRRLQPDNMPVQMLAYTVEMFGPNSSSPDYRLHTLKLVPKIREDQFMRPPQ